MINRSVSHSVYFKIAIVASAATVFLIIPGVALCEENVADKLRHYSWEQVGLAGAMLVLLATLFYLLFRWSQRCEQASYLGKIFAETVFEFEFNRRKAHIEQKRRDGEYIREALLKNDWFQNNPKKTFPSLPPELYQFCNNRRDAGFGGPQGRQSGLGGLGSGDPGYGGYDKVGCTTLDETYQSPVFLDIEKIYKPPAADLNAHAKYEVYQAKYEAYQKEWNEVAHHNQEWDQRLGKAQADIYNQALNKVLSDAKEASDSAADVDISIFRGRGPTFVLEFTAIVVIIFSALILGVLERLDPDQIGTLLAAIAGYVLGRSKDQSGASNRISRQEKESKSEKNGASPQPKS